MIGLGYAIKVVIPDKPALAMASTDAAAVSRIRAPSAVPTLAVALSSILGVSMFAIKNVVLRYESGMTGKAESRPIVARAGAPI